MERKHPPLVSRYETFTMVEFRLDPDEPWETEGPPDSRCFGSFKVYGNRADVENVPTGNTVEHGTWHKGDDEAVKLYTGEYLPGKYTMTGGPLGIVWLCFLTVKDRLHPLIEHEVCEGSLDVAVGWKILVPSGAVDIEGEDIRTENRLVYGPWDHEVTLSGNAEVILLKERDPHV